MKVIELLDHFNNKQSKMIINSNWCILDNSNNYYNDFTVLRWFVNRFEVLIIEIDNKEFTK